MKRILLSLMLVTASLLGFSQQAQPLSIDAKTRVGKLDNGLTYYIRHNNLPEKRADFYIAQQVGSVLEDDTQRGLAHFLEHMAFNGLKNLPGKTMINYLEKIGVKFGENLNAGTGWDQTVYNISNVPVTRQGIIDTCLLILHDWSSFISLDEAEIDNERGVIREEWRTRNGADIRTMEAMLPIVFQGSQYGNRMPIGLIEIINTFPYQTLRDYYDKWYRPDLQAIIIVGDIDVDAVEAQIKTMFADIQPNENPAERIQYEVPSNSEPIVAVVLDPEASHTMVSIYQKHEAVPPQYKNDVQYLVLDYAKSLVQSMVNNRLQDMAQKASNPFAQAFYFDSQFLVAQTKDAATMMAIPKEGKIPATIEAMFSELKKIEQYGFTISEFERAKASYLASLESVYNERDKQKNEYYVDECVANFMEGEPMPGIEMTYTLITQIAPAITVDMINQMVMQGQLSGNDMIVTITGPKKDGLTYPVEADVLAILAAVQAKEVEAYKEDVNNDPLIAKMPKPGKIKSTKELSQFGAEEWLLSNGARVVVKTTDFKADEILVGISSKGGMSLEMDENPFTLKSIPELVEVGGYGAFDKVTLSKKLAGKQVYLVPTMGAYTEGMSGGSTPKDIETLMQLIYLQFTSVRQDDEAFQAYISSAESMLKNQEANPMITLRDTMSSVFYNSHPFSKMLKYDNLKEIDYKRALEVYKERFGNAGDFVFYFVGNVDVATLKPLVEKYIASLPASKKRENWKDVGAEIVAGNVIRHYEKILETPKSTVLIDYSGKIDATVENMVMMNVFTAILDIVFTEEVREKEGGTYGVSVWGSVEKTPAPIYDLGIFFDTNPQMKDKLIGIIHGEINKIATDGPRKADLDKVKENSIKKHNEEIAENKYWSKIISHYYFEDINMNEGYVDIINSITVDKVKAFAQELLKDKNVKEIVQSSKAE